MKKLSLLLVSFTCLSVNSLSQTQLDIQGDPSSTDTVAQIKVNFSGTADVVGLSVYSETQGILFPSGTAGYFYGGGLGIFGESTFGYGVRGQSSLHGAYFRGGNGAFADIVLGGSNYFAGSDDGVIMSDPNKSGSDIFLVSNDAVIIELDNDANETGNFEIWDQGDNKIFGVKESGATDIRSNSTLSTPQLVLHENNINDFARLSFENNSSSNFWTLAASPSGSHPISEFNLYYNGFGNVLTAKGNGDVRMNGNVGIGLSASAPIATLHIKENGNSPSGGIRLENDSNTHYWETYNAVSGGGTHYSFAWNGDLKAQIAFGNGSYLQISDRKLKKNIEQLEPVLDRVLQLSPSRYQFKLSPDSEPTSIGFIAQEVEPLFPEFVNESNGTYLLAYHNFGVIAIRAIQEQQKIIQSQQEKIEKQEGQIEAMNLRLRKIEKYLASDSEKS